MVFKKNGDQLTEVIRESQAWVRRNGTDAASLTPQDRITLASQGWLRDEIAKVLGFPIWAVAFGLVVNASVQALRWVLGG